MEGRLFESIESEEEKKILKKRVQSIRYLETQMYVLRPICTLWKSQKKKRQRRGKEIL